MKSTEAFVVGPDRGRTSLKDRDKQSVDDLREKLREWMVRVKDPALGAFDHRHEPEMQKRFLQDYRSRAAKEVEALKPYEKENGYRF